LNPTIIPRCEAEGRCNHTTLRPLQYLELQTSNSSLYLSALHFTILYLSLQICNFISFIFPDIFVIQFRKLKYIYKLTPKIRHYQGILCILLGYLGLVLIFLLVLIPKFNIKMASKLDKLNLFGLHVVSGYAPNMLDLQLEKVLFDWL